MVEGATDPQVAKSPHFEPQTPEDVFSRSSTPLPPSGFSLRTSTFALRPSLFLTPALSLPGQMSLPVLVVCLGEVSPQVYSA